MRYLELVGLYKDEFESFCKDIPRLVCSDCGEDNIEIKNAETNTGTCHNINCVCYKMCIVMSPCMESIWGAEGNTVLEGGTGEMRNGRQSCSGKMWELHRASPKVANPESVNYEMPIYSIMEPDKAWLRSESW